MAGNTGVTNLSEVASGATSLDKLSAASLEGFESNEDTAEEELTKEQITNKLNEIKEKDQTTLNEEDKKFLNENKEDKVSIEDLKAKPEDTLTEDEKKLVKGFDDKKETNNKVKLIQDKKEEERTDEEKKVLEDYIKETTPLTAIQQLTSHYGEKIEGEFADDVDGLISFVDKLGDNLANNKANEMLTKFPEVGRLLQHRAKGGTLESFMKGVRTPDFSKVELKKEDVDGLKDMYTSYLKSTGLSLSDIGTLVQSAEDEGEDILFNKAKGGQEIMIKQYNDQVQVQVDQEKLVQEDNDRKINTYWNEANNVLKSGSLEGVKIPINEMRDFEVALKETDDKQATRIDYEYANLTVGQRLFLDYLVFKKFDVKGLNLERKSTVGSLSNLLGQQDSVNQLAGGNTAGAEEKFDISELTFNPSKMKVI